MNEKQNKTEIPQHIAIVPDGNRRWAKSKGLPTLLGHKKGFDRTFEIITHAQELGVKVVTFYAFSTENWNRARKEVDYLMNLFVMFFDKKMAEMNRLGIQIRHLGDLERLSQNCSDRIKAGVELTKNNAGLVVQLAINYGGHDELKRAVQKIVAKKYKPENIDESVIRDNLDTAGIVDPDLMIRTSGEERLSNFLLWQSAYSELYFPTMTWPDFTKTELDHAIEEYNHRNRRHGK